MRICASWCSRAMLVGALVGFNLSLAGTPARAQGQDHVVTFDELKRDAAQPAELRHAHEAAVKDFLSSAPAQKALKSAHLDFEQVNQAVGQLSDEDLAKLAERSREAQKDFAAGRISDRDLLWIILIIVAVLIIALAVR